MEPSINKIMKSRNIAAAAKRYGLSDNDMWNLYYDTGIVFIECLKVNVKHKCVFDRVFKPFISQLGDMPLTSVFEMIEYSPAFWQWWANHLWCVCFNCRGDVKLMLNELMSDTFIIPTFTLRKIINGNRQKSGSGTPKYGTIERKAKRVKRKKVEAGA